MRHLDQDSGGSEHVECELTHVECEPTEDACQSALKRLRDMRDGGFA